jgi:hypothetical protein
LSDTLSSGEADTQRLRARHAISVDKPILSLSASCDNTTWRCPEMLKLIHSRLDGRQHPCLLPITSMLPSEPSVRAADFLGVFSKWPCSCLDCNAKSVLLEGVWATLNHLRRASVDSVNSSSRPSSSSTTSPLGPDLPMLSLQSLSVCYFPREDRRRWCQ